MRLQLIGTVIGAAAIVMACGGGSGDQTSAADGGPPSSLGTPQYDASTLGRECLATPGPGQKLQFNMYWKGMPASFFGGDFKAIGPMPFEGDTYQAVEINATNGFFYTADDVKQTVLFKPEAPLVPLAAISHRDPGTTADDQRYRYTYLDPVSLNVVQPDLTGLPLNTPRKYLVRQERGVSGMPLSPPSGRAEVTVTYVGRADIIVKGVEYRQACKVEWSHVAGVPLTSGTVWLAPNHGIVKVEGGSLKKPVSGYLETTGVVASH